jgi:hypothetical protein
MQWSRLTTINSHLVKRFNLYLHISILNIRDTVSISGFKSRPVQVDVYFQPNGWKKDK